MEITGTLYRNGPSNLSRAMYFTNSNTGWIVGSQNLISKTTNGGENWTRQTGNNHSYEDVFL
ncbi:MAG: hypothetical protein IPL53_25065 [Ignavibacteria bacterium]|nr:hypothetical protein [Ignavibacteria bacterium]